MTSFLQKYDNYSYKFSNFISKFVIHYILYTPFITITSVLYTYSLLYVPPKIIKVRIGDADENKLQKNGKAD
ncbi:MAG TPA: hypothetical protein DC034_07355 [Clostridium sp.]|nr:hypothetical protein [Clostridium sp.]